MSSSKIKKFKDYPDFQPNLTPSQMFKLGSFGGTYWRPIYSSITGKNYEKQHHKHPKSWWRGIPEPHLSSPTYRVQINKYGVKVGSTLEFWENKNWITKYDPYGWFQWYCRFYCGRRCPDDERQIKRWINYASEKGGRWRRRLIGLCNKKDGVKSVNDYTISPVIRQGLQHWAFILKSDHFKQTN